jgi:hypothetical protein
VNESDFTWKGQELGTIGQLFDAMLAVESDEEAAEFMAAYRASSPHADVNIGYLTGYCSPEEAERLRARFNVSHPIFGRKSPTPEQALEAGKRAALGESDTGDAS